MRTKYMDHDYEHENRTNSNGAEDFVLKATEQCTIWIGPQWLTKCRIFENVIYKFLFYHKEN